MLEKFRKQSREKVIIGKLAKGNNKRGVIMEGVSIDRALRDKLDTDKKKTIKKIKNKLIDLLQLNPMKYDTAEINIGYDVMKEKFYILLVDAWDTQTGGNGEEEKEKIDMLLTDIESILSEIGVNSIEREESEVSPRILFSLT